MVISIDESAVVCAGVELYGDIEIGPGCVLHPNCLIDGRIGKVILKSNCLVYENVQIIANVHDLVIDDGNEFLMGAIIEANLGRNNVIGMKAHVQYPIGNGCRIGPTMIIHDDMMEDECSIVWNNDDRLICKRDEHEIQEQRGSMLQLIRLWKDKTQSWYLGHFHTLRQ